MVLKEPLINCGERTIQVLGRISIQDILKDKGLNIGDKVEVFLKKVN